jgi:hypothetical protein
MSNQLKGFYQAEQGNNEQYFTIRFSQKLWKCKLRINILTRIVCNFLIATSQF